jgi:outer membrane protein TolC
MSGRVNTTLSAIMLWVTVTAHAETNEAAAPLRLSLEQAYQRTLASDQNIAVAWQEVQKARLLTWQALTRITPRVTARGSYFKPEDTINTPIGLVADETKSANLAVQWPILDPAVFPEFQAGQLGRALARLRHRFTIRHTLFGVTTAYYNVLKAQQVEAVNRETLELARQQLDLARKRLGVGQVTRSDVLRARVVAERADRALTDAQGRLRLAQTQLAAVLNEPPQNVYSLTVPPEYPAPTAAYDELLRSALAAREDYQAAGLAVRQAEAGRREIKARYAPRLVLQAKQEWAEPESLLVAQNEWQATASVELPIFEGGLREVQLKKSGHVIEQAKLQRADLARQIEVEVKAACVRTETLARTLKAVRAEVDAAAENYKNLQVQYEAGTATSLDVADALRDLNNARTELAVQTWDYQVALRDLERVTGRFQEERVNQSR